MDDSNPEEAKEPKVNVEPSECADTFWDDYLAWCRANENSAHE